MTIVRVNIKAPADGPPVSAIGSLRWQPTLRRILPAEGDEPAAILLPNEFLVTLVEGEADIDVEPNTGAWVWAVMEQFKGQPTRRRYLHIPNQASVDYTDLVEVDPGTLGPIPAALVPAWAAALAETDTRLSQGILTPDPDDPGFFLIGAS